MGRLPGSTVSLYRGRELYNEKYKEVKHRIQTENTRVCTVCEEMSNVVYLEPGREVSCVRLAFRHYIYIYLIFV